MITLLSILKIYYYKDKEIYQYLKNVFGIKPKNIFIYKVAFIHKSTSQKILNGHKLNNERLEFLGDSILNSLIAEYLYKKFPLKDEGFLTKSRSKLVSRNTLNNAAFKLGMSDIVKKILNKTNSTETINGNTLEAFIGALFIDKGYDYTRDIVFKKIFNVAIDIDEIIRNDNNYKSKLLEILQKRKLNFEFRNINKEYDKDQKRFIFTIALFIEDKLIAQAIDFRIKEAEQQTCKIALENIYNA